MQDALRPTVLRTKLKAPSPGPSGEAIKPQPQDRRPAEGAINSGRQAGVQRRKRSTPIAGRVFSGEGLITPTAERARWQKGLSLQTTGRGRGRRAYHSV